MLTKNRISIELPKEVEDNSYIYLYNVLTVLEYSDPGGSLTMKNSAEGYRFTIEPSQEDFKQDIIQNLLFLHRRFKLPIKYSKSLGISRLISFTVDFK